MGDLIDDKIPVQRMMGSKDTLAKHLHGIL